MLKRTSPHPVALDIQVRNLDNAPLRMLVEPWATEVLIPGDGVVHLDFEGPNPASIEIHVGPSGVILYGWRGSLLDDRVDPLSPRD
ncbi:MAG: hypothetical protein QOF11_1386 [Chloroflexota bacterium]|nr:hypothetical protein [Chloroflexota bacterium]